MGYTEKRRKPAFLSCVISPVPPEAVVLVAVGEGCSGDREEDKGDRHDANGGHQGDAEGDANDVQDDFPGFAQPGVEAESFVTCPAWVSDQTSSHHLKLK